MSDIEFLRTLEAIVRQRIASRETGSYTVQLVESGVRRMGQKVGEEGVEVALAAVSGDHSELLDESADLLYHLIVLLASCNLSLADVSATLEKRHR